MGSWGTQTYVNCYVTHIIGVSLGHSANCAYFICIYTLVSYASILYICIATSSLPPPEEGRTAASLTVGRVTSRVAVLTRAERAQLSGSITHTRSPVLRGKSESVCHLTSLFSEGTYFRSQRDQIALAYDCARTYLFL